MGKGTEIKLLHEIRFPHSLGLLYSAFTAFLDLSLGIANPALGLVANHSGLNSIFLVSTIIVLCAVPVALRLLRVPGEPTARLKESL